VIVYQQQEGRGIGIVNKIRAYALQDAGADTIEANELLGLDVDLRTYEQCAEILLELGLRRLRVMSNNPDKLRALEEAGLEVVERVRLEVEPARSFLRLSGDEERAAGAPHQLIPASLARDAGAALRAEARGVVYKE
jgi:3,4-dihydroxy 2-butanone 4-phosphate synthase/GTP cyclohydrolase II